MRKKTQSSPGGAGVKFRYRGSYLSYIVTYFSYYACLAVFSTALSVYLTGIGKTKTELSFIISASNLFGIVITPAVGYLNDRLRKPRGIACGCMLLAAVFTAVFALTRSTAALYLLNGSIMGLAMAASPITERIASGGRFRYGTVRVWGTIGYAVCAQACGSLMEHTDPALIFALFCVFAVTAAANFLMTGGIRYEEPERTQLPAGSPAFLKNPSFLLFAVCSFLFAGGNNIAMSYCPLFLQELGMNAGSIGAALAVSTLAEIPLILWSNRFMDRFSGKTLLLANFAIMLLQFGLYGVIYRAAAAVTVMLLLKACSSTLFMMIRLKIIRNIVSEECVSTAQGVESAINAVGGAAFLNLAGVLSQWKGLHTLFLAEAGMMALGMGLGLFLRAANTKKIFS